MIKSISPQIQAEICTLCDQISVDHSLDSEIRDELLGHMEDKLLSYMNGDERLTEQDAFILVREHFGNLAAIEGLFQDVYAANSWTLRILIAAIGCINTALGSVGVLLSLYITVAGLLIIQNAVHLVGPDNLLASPYPPVLIGVLGLPQFCLMLASGIGIMRRKPWGRMWSFVCAFYMLITAPLGQWVAHLGGNEAPGGFIATAVSLTYALLIIVAMTLAPRKRLISSIA
jgi:hypothetical protein